MSGLNYSMEGEPSSENSAQNGTPLDCVRTRAAEEGLRLIHVEGYLTSTVLWVGLATLVVGVISLISPIRLIFK